MTNLNHIPPEGQKNLDHQSPAEPCLPGKHDRIWNWNQRCPQKKQQILVWTEESKPRGNSRQGYNHWIGAADSTKPEESPVDPNHFGGLENWRTNSILGYFSQINKNQKYGYGPQKGTQKTLLVKIDQNLWFVGAFFWPKAVICCIHQSNCTAFPCVCSKQTFDMH